MAGRDFDRYEMISLTSSSGIVVRIFLVAMAGLHAKATAERSLFEPDSVDGEKTAGSRLCNG